MKALSRLKSVDFYKKLPSDLTEATITGAGLSIIASVVMALLLIAEFSSFMAIKTDSQMTVDRSQQTDLLRINFNITFPAMGCEFATLDVSDALGTKRMNLTKTVRKTPLDAEQNRVGVAARDERLPTPKYHTEDETDALMEALSEDDVDVNRPITAAEFTATTDRYPIVVVNFYAPWCPWCQRLEPAWMAAANLVHEDFPESDRRIRMARVDCTLEVGLCRKHLIQGFPTIRIFRKGSDDVLVDAHHEHESYHGDRTVEALVKFANALAPTAGEPLSRVPNVRRSTASHGCNFQGFVFVKKVPGTLHFHAANDGHSFDHAALNATHEVSSFFFGAKPSPSRSKLLARLHPGGLEPSWSDKLADQQFRSLNERSTHEHYMQVVLTSVESGPVGPRALRYDAYEYTSHYHTYNSDAVPAAKFSYQPSPIQIVVREERRKWYHFLTTTCAIIGGVFTVAGIMDSMFYSTYKLAKKVELGKQG